jgi:hypothetical protein
VIRVVEPFRPAEGLVGADGVVDGFPGPELDLEGFELGLGGGHVARSARSGMGLLRRCRRKSEHPRVVWARGRSEVPR